MPNGWKKNAGNTKDTKGRARLGGASKSSTSFAHTAGVKVTIHKLRAQPRASGRLPAQSLATTLTTTQRAHVKRATAAAAAAATASPKEATEAAAVALSPAAAEFRPRPAQPQPEC